MIPQSRLRPRLRSRLALEPDELPVVALPVARPAAPILGTPEPLPAVTPVVPVVPIDESITGPAPLTTTDRRGRPRILPGIPETERLPAERQLLEQLQSYEPRKRSILRQIGLGALRGFVAGGPGGAISGGIFGAGTALLDPTAEDRAWRDRQVAQSMERQQAYRAQQRAGLQDELLQAQVAETQAQAEQRRNPRPRLVEQVLPDGTTVLAPEQPGVITGRPKPEGPTYAIDVPGGGRIEGLKPGEAAGYYGQIGRQRTEAEIRGEERMSQFERARVSLTQAEAAEKENLAQRKAASEQLSRLRAQRASLKPNPALVTFNGQINDPDYWAQADALDAQIKDTETEAARRQRLADEAGNEARRLRGELGRYGARPTASTTPPPPPGVTEAKVRAEARSRKEDEEAAVRRAREWKWIP